MKIKEKALEESKCKVCMKIYYKRTKVTASRKSKGGRSYHATYTCSPVCSRLYDVMYKHFKYAIKKANLAKVGEVIDKLYEREFKELEKVQKKCVENSYNPEKDEWNHEHFNRCDGDITAKRLDILDELKQKLFGGENE